MTRRTSRRVIATGQQNTTNAVDPTSTAYAVNDAARVMA
jgi:hypothetical protein